MKTTVFALIGAVATVGGSLAADVSSTPEDAKSVEQPPREERSVETVVRSPEDVRKQSAEFNQEGWSIHFRSPQKTNEDGTVVWRWKLSRPPGPDPAPVDFSREHKDMMLVGTSHADLREQLAQLHREGWAVHGLSGVLTNDDGTLTRSLTMSRPQAINEANKEACIYNLYQLRGAIHQWALENSKNITDPITLADLEWYFRNYDEFPSCPSGGTYSVRTVWDMPRCSIPGHRLMLSYEEWKAEHN